MDILDTAECLVGLVSLDILVGREFLVILVTLVFRVGLVLVHQVIRVGLE